jgi:hypothetical protein
MIALDYQEDLSKWADVDYYDTHVLRVQLPYIAPTTTPGLTLEQQKERKRELARRLMEINARKREERVGVLNNFISISYIHYVQMHCQLMCFILHFVASRR